MSCCFYFYLLFLSERCLCLFILAIFNDCRSFTKWKKIENELSRILDFQTDWSWGVAKPPRDSFKRLFLESKTLFFLVMFWVGTTKCCDCVKITYIKKIKDKEFRKSISLSLNWKTMKQTTEIKKKRFTKDVAAQECNYASNFKCLVG